MARTTGTTSLVDLLEAGKLQAGERLVLNRLSAPNIDGVLEADGTIIVGEVASRSPSEAARKALNLGQPIDGWARWRVVRLGGITLASVRDG